MPPPQDSSTYRLLVEGTDDVHSVIHLMERHGFDWDNSHITRPFVANSGSVGQLLEAFPVALKGPYDRLGVVVDANMHLDNRWAQLRDRAVSVGVNLPAVPAAHGTIATGLRTGSRVGVWLMPDNMTPGRLEDFLGKLVPMGDPVWSYAGEVVVAARQMGAPCRENDHLKSRLHTWLAWQEDPGLPFGTALSARLFLHDSPEALAFVRWFNRLFVDLTP